MADKILNPQVSIIPATKRHLKNGDQFRSQPELRVAAYCRVSTEEESQENSYAAQKNHYMMLITNRPGWEMAGIYADEGKSGTTRNGRIHFNELIDDCRAGKIDYIITKSISRFARNTSDALDCVHELQRLRPPVGIYFERENIDTLNTNSEMFLTFYCSMAQEESRSISENIKWSLQKNFRSGKPQINLRRMIGYDMCRDGSWVINREEAVTVSFIYTRFLEGVSANAIAKELNEADRKTVNGKRWRADTVLYVLRNEKYAGDLIMQKTFTESFLTHRAVKNTGEYPQYFKKDHHPAIVSRDVWNRTQEMIAYRQREGKHSTRKVTTELGGLEIGLDDLGNTTQEISIRIAEQKKGRGATKKPFSIVTCAGCGQKMRRMCYNAYLKNYKDERSHDGKEIPPEESDFVDSYTFSYAVWKCSACKNESKKILLTEISMEQSFMEMIYRIKRDVEDNGEQSEIMRTFQIVYDTLCRRERNSGIIEQKLHLVEMEIAELDRNYDMTLERMRTANYAEHIQLGEELITASGNIYARLAEDLKVRREEKKQEQHRLMGERGVARAMKKNFEAFLLAISNLPDKNRAGLQINSSVETAEETIASVPDFLNFDEHIFRTYILRMEAAGDEVYYGTTFGLTLTSVGNSRPIREYIGYRQTRSDGTSVIITDQSQIATGKIQHHWKKRSKRRKENKDDQISSID